jgi:hypothetical protein
MRIGPALALATTLALSGCATTYYYPGTGTYGTTESRIVTYGSVSPALYDAVEARSLWAPDPTRPRDCPRYVIDPEDECY